MSAAPYISLLFIWFCSVFAFANNESTCTFSKIPAAPGIYTATAQCTDGDWTHFYIEGTEDLLLFSIKSDGVVDISPSDVTIGIPAAGGYVDLTNVEYAASDIPWIVMNRYWKVNPATQPSQSGVRTRIYFTNQEFNDVSAEVNRQGGNISSPNDLIFFHFDPGFNIDPNPTAAEPHEGATKNNLIQPSHTSGMLNSNIQFAEFTTYGFSGGGAGGSTIGNILPIQLSNFFVEEVENKAEIIWTTVTELDNEFFTVLHSINGMDFREIERIAGAGTSNTPTNYKVYDLNPALGINYYRLKQIDFDGRETLSEIKAIKFRGTKYIDVVPTMVVNQVRIDIPEPFDLGAILKIFDSNGRMVFLSQFGSSEIRKTLDLSNFSAGNYLVKVSDGNIFLSKRFIKVDGY